MTPPEPGQIFGMPATVVKAIDGFSFAMIGNTRAVIAQSTGLAIIDLHEVSAERREWLANWVADRRVSRVRR